MKVLPERIGQGGTWENRLVKDMAYIKQHLRYPITKKTLMPAILLVVVLLSLLTFLGIVFLSNEEVRPVSILLVYGVNIVTFCMLTFRYLDTLRFEAVPTGLFLQENKVLLEQFLKAQQLLVFRHPDMPEVFQIVSRNVSKSTVGEKREVIIFIADDRRILLNSHFTGSNWNLPEKRHHKQMVKSLKEWIKSHPSAGTALTHQTF